jgi:hypothetical protein
MKLLGLFVGLIAAASIGTGIYVVMTNRDPAPQEVIACVREKDLVIARSPDALGVARQDVIAGRLSVVRRWDFGRTEAALLAPGDRSYAVLALANADTSSVRGGRREVGLRIYEKPNTFPLVALETPDRGRLAACAQKVAG